MSCKLRWGILTTGMIARKFAADLRGSRLGVLTAVGARRLADAEHFAREFGATRAYGSYQSVLADPEIDAVYVATPHPMHEEWVVRAAHAGKHILCEKPLALDHAGASRMVEAARQAGVLLMEAFMYRCHPQTALLARLVRTGAIGKVRLIRATFNIQREFDPEHRIFKRELGGGAILDLGCYPVSWSRLIAGAALGLPVAEPLEFHGCGHLHPVAQTDDYATAVAKFPGGIVAELACGTTVTHEIHAQIHGSNGWIEVPMPFFPGPDGQAAQFLLHRAGSSGPEVHEIPAQGGLYAFEADAVAEALARGEREVAAMTPADTLANMRLLDSWRASVGVHYQVI